MALAVITKMLMVFSEVPAEGNTRQKKSQPGLPGTGHFPPHLQGHPEPRQPHSGARAGRSEGYRPYAVGGSGILILMHTMPLLCHNLPLPGTAPCRSLGPCEELPCGLLPGKVKASGSWHLQCFLQELQEALILSVKTD